MLGWEYPPIITGGLGVVCEAISKTLVKKGIDVNFFIPTGWHMNNEGVEVYAVDNLVIKPGKFSKIYLSSLLLPYMSEKEFDAKIEEHFRRRGKRNIKALYGQRLLEEIYFFAARVALLARTMDFDIIHAHDWLTYPAGVLLKKLFNKPLVVHIHATAFDASGLNNVDETRYKIEKEGFDNADKIIAVSNYTKQMLVHFYSQPPDKIIAIHNAMDDMGVGYEKTRRVIKPSDKIVLFVGRLTIQKGPEYFIRAAKKVVEIDPNVKFVIVGSGDMEAQMIEEAARLGVSSHVLFSGFIPREKLGAIYSMADVFVMPSVSEPFGLTALEAAKYEVPVIVSKRSGVSEVLSHSLKVDFWDVDAIANKILAVLHYRTLKKLLKKHGRLEVESLTWDKQVDKIIDVYKSLIK